MTKTAKREARSRGRPRKFDEDKVLDAALEVFRLKGYSGTSMDDLAAATGLNKPSLYGAFGNKQALYDGSVKRYWNRAGGSYLAALFTGGSLKDDLKAYFHTFIDLITTEERGGCIVACTLPSEVSEEPTFLRRYDKILGQSDAALQKRLEQGQNEGDLPADVNIEKLAQVIVDMSFGISLRARSSASPAELKSQADYGVEALI
ncbi:TetR/AcrR family transcriptional regulator [Sneathiella limimaris]|uniref:TetR/AcrR family transcriptional regulator n=1 Tax=Sneathiella limimaris TaxID=1964213 RepID=UPI00146EEE36|nr:TetR/AcrR family transcriptional regulator [Sneathiella limimaris]